MTRIFTDISVSPDFTGLPSNVYHGLVHLTDNAAAVLILVAGLGLVWAVRPETAKATAPAFKPATVSA